MWFYPEKNKLNLQHLFSPWDGGVLCSQSKITPSGQETAGVRLADDTYRINFSKMMKHIDGSM